MLKEKLSQFFESMKINGAYIVDIYTYLLTNGSTVDLRELSKNINRSLEEIESQSSILRDYDLVDFIAPNQLRIKMPVFVLLHTLMMKRLPKMKNYDMDSLQNSLSQFEELKVVIQKNSNISREIHLDTVPFDIYEDAMTLNPEDINDTPGDFCSRCGKPLDETYYDVHMNSYCEKCYNDYTGYCEQCNSVYPSEELTDTDFEIVCKECLELWEEDSEETSSNTWEFKQVPQEPIVHEKPKVDQRKPSEFKSLLKKFTDVVTLSRAAVLEENAFTIKEADLERGIINALVIGPSSKEYLIEIDSNLKLLRHNCHDFETKKAENKKFCKHLTKLFLILRSKDEQATEALLKNISENIEKWEFKS